MKFALDTYRNIAHGGDRRTHALFTLAMWFVAGTYVASTALFYFGPYESTAAAMVGGAVVACAVAAIKFV